MSAATSNFRELYKKAPRPIQRNCDLWRDAIAALDAARTGQKVRTARIWGRRMGVRPSSVFSRRSEYRKHGAIALLDKRFSPACWRGQPRNRLPAPAAVHLQKLAADGHLTTQEAIRAFLHQLRRWQRGQQSARIPGWSAPPKGTPPGCSTRNLARVLGSRPRRPVTFRIITIVRTDGVIISQKVTRL